MGFPKIITIVVGESYGLILGKYNNLCLALAFDIVECRQPPGLFARVFKRGTEGHPVAAPADHPTGKERANWSLESVFWTLKPMARSGHRS
jgi:hypothetical protein